jgi:hypothetical protein
MADKAAGVRRIEIDAAHRQREEEIRRRQAQSRSGAQGRVMAIRGAQVATSSAKSRDSETIPRTTVEPPGPGRWDDQRDGPPRLPPVAHEWWQSPFQSASSKPQRNPPIESDTESNTADVNLDKSAISGESEVLSGSMRMQQQDPTDLRHLLASVQAAVKGDSSASNITNLKHPRSIETMENVIGQFAAMYTKLREDSETKDRRIASLQSDKNIAEQLSIQRGSDLENLQARYRTLSNEKDTIERALGQKHLQLQESVNRFNGLSIQLHNVSTESKQFQADLIGKSNDFEKLEGHYEKMKKKWDAEKVGLISTHATTMEARDQDWAFRLDNEKSNWEANSDLEKKELETKFDTIKRDLENKYNQLDKAHNILKVKHAQEIEAAIRKEKSRNEEHVRRVEREKEDAIGELLKREHVQSLKDPEIKRRFEDLCLRIDTIARIDWSDRGRRWPVTSERLKHSGNPRESRQCLLQDKIWRTLYAR